MGTSLVGGKEFFFKGLRMREGRRTKMKIIMLVDGEGQKIKIERERDN